MPSSRPPAPRVRTRLLASAALVLLAATGCTASPATSSSTSSMSSAAPAALAAPASLPASGTSSAAAVEGDAATVVRVVDGDTVDVRRGAEDVRVRLLNIDTPETKHPSRPVECLGPEATRKLEELLRPGDEVVLQYDEERFDRYGRTLAGVVEGETLVNAEIARAGLGVPVVFEPNRRFLPPVEAAWAEAQREGAGLNQPGLECSLQALQESVAQDPAPAAVSELAQALEAVEAEGQEWMKVHYAAVIPLAVSLVQQHGGRADVPSAGAASVAPRASTAPAVPAAPQAPAAGAGSDTAERDRQRAAEAQAAADRAERERQAEARAEAQRQAQAQEQVQARERAAQASREAEAAASAREKQKGTSSGSSTAKGFADTSARDTSSGSTSSSGGTSQKAPNRCYAPGGETFVYCSEGSTGSSSGGSSSSASAGASSSGAGTSSGGAGGPVSGADGVCPAGYPVKVSSSGKYHVPGGQYYDDTSAKRCYASTAAAEADGAVASKR